MEVNSFIFFNLDVLYPKDGEPYRMSFNQAFSFLLHEFGHHHSLDEFLQEYGVRPDLTGPESHFYLDQLAERFSKHIWTHVEVKSPFIEKI